MIGIGISADPIYGRFLWLRWLIGYRITVVVDVPRMIRLQRRQSGLTKKGNPYAWRMCRDSPLGVTIYSWDIKCKRHTKGSFEYSRSYYGLNDFRGRAYSKTASPKYFNTDIITLDFGKK